SRVLLHTASTLLAVSLLTGAGLAQLPPSNRTWSRTYGGPVSSQGLYDLHQLPGGTLVAAGFTGSFGGLTPFNWLLRLDLTTGDVLTEAASSSVPAGITDGAAVAADGGALFLGRNVLDLFTKHDAWLLRVDASGGVVWSQGFTRPGSGKHFLFDAVELGDGSWIAVGATSILDFPPQPAWIVRLGPDGVPLWHHEYGAGIAETARSVTATSDGGFAVAGWTNSSGAGSDDAWVMKIDASGAIEWQRTYGGLDADQLESIVELDGGGFAVAGSTNSLTSSGHAPWVLRLSGTGALLWHRAVASDVWGDLGAVAQANDGQLIVVGRVGEPGFPSNDLWCAKLSTADGQVLWQRAYEGDTGDFGSTVLPLASAGFVLGGTWGWGFPGESIWLNRTDRVGSLADCDIVRTTAFSLIGPPILVRPGATVRAPGGAQTQAVGVQVAASAAEVIEICR
ncbi:MAG TPA: hypothetical protein VFD43_05865, partial [Planctomycetota bacterium]|nr:hypothetical protein [Planctomycetota bacterium]